ncbi:MAG: type II toxin-antitoxin system VapC family toxin [Syntrophomonas sp.]
MIKNYIFDAYAVLSYLQNEPCAEEVFALLRQAQEEKNKLYMTWINIGEVYYRVWREYGKLEAERVLDVLSAWPMEILVADSELTIAAAAVKAQNKLAYADAFAIGAAILKQAELVTGDPEIKLASQKLGFNLYWIDNQKGT